MGYKATNFADTTLSESITATSTSLSLATGEGANFPTLSASDWTLVLLTDKYGNREWVKIVARTGDVLTVGTTAGGGANVGGRGYESTTALAITYTDNHSVRCAMSAGLIEDIADYTNQGSVTATVAEINTLASSGITNADLVKVHAITQSAAQINNSPPIGTILAYMPGYFTDNANAGFTYQLVSANTVAAVNALLNDEGYYVCNGAALNDSDSTIFNGAGRYLPNLTDDRFLMGDTVAGGTGGANSNDISHTHTTAEHTLTTDEIPAHTHTYDKPVSGSTVLSVGLNYARVTVTSAQASGSAGGGSAHEHGDTGSAGSETLENKPLYLSCYYIMRVK